MALESRSGVPPPFGASPGWRTASARKAEGSWLVCLAYRGQVAKRPEAVVVVLRHAHQAT